MPTRARRRPPLALQWMELAWAAPWVVAHRLAQSDGPERARMVTEKLAAGVESWGALANHAFALHRSLIRELMRHRSWSSLATGAPFLTWMNLLRQGERGLAAMASPYRRRATANALRLGRRSARRRR